MSSPFAAPPRLLGVRLSDTYTSPRHELGSVILGENGTEYRYVKAAEALGQYVPVDFNGSFEASECDAGDVFLGVPQVAIASGSYGWVATRGKATVKVTASLGAGASLGHHCTAGGLANAAVESKAGDGTRGVTLAAEAGTPAGVASILL